MYIDFDGMGTHDVINVGHTRNNAKDAATVHLCPEMHAMAKMTKLAKNRQPLAI